MKISSVNGESRQIVLKREPKNSLVLAHRCKQKPQLSHSLIVEFWVSGMSPETAGNTGFSGYPTTTWLWSWIYFEPSLDPFIPTASCINLHFFSRAFTCIQSFDSPTTFCYYCPSLVYLFPSSLFLTYTLSKSLFLSQYIHFFFPSAYIFTIRNHAAPHPPHSRCDLVPGPNRCIRGSRILPDGQAIRAGQTHSPIGRVPEEPTMQGHDLRSAAEKGANPAPHRDGLRICREEWGCSRQDRVYRPHISVQDRCDLRRACMPRAAQRVDVRRCLYAHVYRVITRAVEGSKSRPNFSPLIYWLVVYSVIRLPQGRGRDGFIAVIFGTMPEPLLRPKCGRKQRVLGGWRLCQFWFL